MILLIITVIFLVGSVAAADTASNDNTIIQHDSSTTEVSASSVVSDTSSVSASDSSKSSSSSSSSVGTHVGTTVNASSSSSSSHSSSKLISNTSSKSIKSSSDSSTSSKIRTTTSVNNAEVGGYDTLVLNATVKNSNNKVISDGTVVFEINGNEIGTATVNNGYAIYKYNIPGYAANKYTISANYSGTDEYYSSSDKSTLTVNKYNTNIKISSIHATPGKTITLKATVKTSSGSNVKNGKLTFKINKKSISTVRVSNGVATTNYTIPKSWADRTYSLYVVYGGNSVYKSSSNDDGKLYLDSIINTKVTVKTVSVTASNTVTLSASVKDSKTSSNINGGKLSFKINGKTIGTVKVSKGGATLKYKVPATWKGSYKISVVYGGYNEYKSASATGTLKVSQAPSTKITVSNIKGAAGSNVTLKATLKTSTGSLVKSGKIAFKINSKTVGTTTVKNGVATLKFHISSEFADSSYTISAVYGTNNNYLSARANGTLSIIANENIPSNLKEYLKATRNCEVNSKTIQSIAKKFSGYTSTKAKATAIFNYLNSITSYSGYYDTRYGAVGTYQRRYGNCVDMSHLLIAVSRASGIPARYCHATCTFRSGLVVGHVWAELYVNGKWVSCDLTSSSNRFGKIVNWRSHTTIHRYKSLPF